VLKKCLNRVQICLFFSLGLISHTLAAEPLYWSATKAEQTLLIIGSIHVGDPSMYPLPNKIESFLATSDGLISEIDLTQAASPVLPAAKLSSAQVLSRRQTDKLSAIFQQYQMPTEALLASPPWLTALSLQMKQLSSLGYSSDWGVDQVLTHQATRLGKPIYPLESVDFQLQLLNALPENGAQILRELIEQWDEADEIFHCQIESWKKGDKTKLLSLLDSDEYDQQMIASLLSNRNKDWAKKLNGQLLPPSGRYLMVVGALHLIGEDNLPALLENAGWHVKRLSAPGKAQCP